MRYEFDYEYSDELLHRAARRSLIHQVGWRVPVMLAVVLALIAALGAAEGWGFLSGACLGGMAMLVLLFYLTRSSAIEQALRFARKLPSRAARCVVTDESLTVENALATSVLKWPVVHSVVRGPEVWLFFLARGQFMALPADKLDGELGAFIESHVTAAGGRMG
jgi:hypothetical protein